ncbi:hypothetical protein ASPZODRAFT_17985 [Penicilliopsis zonata CBS 506.65]|uniref:Zn(2)-C6 fungal-type domain-containing protein n=1 Tax=Penicilliopsis zonata CBS 506.65 TaxID=1073090 RepID=A0A1L9SD80_9EURO|nr:hypothetical protein ASPZODRAFT_17985 [Penicilliopsis zonata CBS 506.65]OJJ45073.1 hypothetical protein ASPZODRAFT_17985 [Penicilliopsis zonata CBS 506.65]
MPESSSPRGPREAKKRTRTGCLTCRARKIKCDETPERCANCRRVMLTCRWPGLGVVPLPRGNGGPRRVACQGCRVARCRCSGEQPCARCRATGADCRYRGAGSAGSPGSGPSPQGSSSPKDAPEKQLTPGTPDAATLTAHLDAFFTHVAPCQANAVVHRGTLLRDVHAGSADRALVGAICAIATRFLPVPSAQEPVWTREAKSLLVREGMRSAPRVAAALLLAKHEMYCAQFETAAMLGAMATSAALNLGFHREGLAAAASSTSDAVARETRRRLFWACFCLDRMLTPGRPDLALIRPGLATAPLPCDEHLFQLGMPGRGALLGEENPGSSLFGQYVQLMSIRADILTYASSRSTAGSISDVSSYTRSPAKDPPWTSPVFSACEQRLHAWRERLPPQCQLRADIIYARHAQHALPALTMLHVWYDQCLSDLYRVAMPNYPETLPTATLLDAPIGWVEEHQLACVQHARGIAQTFATVGAHVDLLAETDHNHNHDHAFLDTSLPMCVFESVRLQLQWLLMLPVEAHPDARAHLRRQVDLLLGQVEPMTRYSCHARWLFDEIRRMLRQHRIFEHREELRHTHIQENHPWVQRIRSLQQTLQDAIRPEQEVLLQDLFPFDTPLLDALERVDWGDV